MDHHLSALRDGIPEHLYPILDWDLIPWEYVKHRHGDQPNTPLIALFGSRRQIGSILNRDAVTSMAIPAESGRGHAVRLLLHRYAAGFCVWEGVSRTAGNGSTGVPAGHRMECFLDFGFWILDHHSCYNGS